MRGNTGVLLQLLECRESALWAVLMTAPRELKHVRESLYTLLTVSPTDVFAVMADDCKGSEEETGASRRNILEFLEIPAASVKEILESGNHLDAEKVFREGFIDVLTTTAIAETRLVLGLLIPLSTVSGKRATTGSSSAFIRTMTTSLHPGSSTALTGPLVRLFAEFIDRDPPVDPRYALLFFSAHGGAVVALALEKQDSRAKGLIERLKAWTGAAVKSWSDKASEEEGDVSAQTLVPRLCTTLVDALLVSFLLRQSLITRTHTRRRNLLWTPPSNLSRSSSSASTALWPCPIVDEGSSKAQSLAGSSTLAGMLQRLRNDLLASPLKHGCGGILGRWLR